MGFSCQLSAQELNQNGHYQQQLDRYIEVVNKTKNILDDPQAKPSVQIQKQALCSRIEAYRSILALTQRYVDQDSAPMMKIIAEQYLERQKHSFEQVGMNETAFCANSTTESVRN